RGREHLMGSKRAHRDDPPRPTCDGVGEQKLELAHLVAAIDRARAIVALDPYAEGLLDRRGKIAERHPRQLRGKRGIGAEERVRHRAPKIRYCAAHALTFPRHCSSCWS